MSEEIERTLCQLPQVHVFKIPVRKTAEGHRASDWPKDPTWTGKVKIVAKGRVAAIVLLDDKNQVFAICQVTDDSSVERTLDSGRYYVLRITNAQGRHAFIGIAFNERNDAFDFNVALAEFKSELEREDQALKLSEIPHPIAMKDLSLKDGEKIKIKINTKKKNVEDEEIHSSGGLKIKNNGLLLPPPRSVSAGKPTPSSTPTVFAVEQQLNSNNDWGFGSDPFADATSFNSAPFSSSDPFTTNDPFACAPAKPPKQATSTDKVTTEVNLLDL